LFLGKKLCETLRRNLAKLCGKKTFVTTIELGGFAALREINQRIGGFGYSVVRLFGCWSISLNFVRL
jgi:hypothetical protein